MFDLNLKVSKTVSFSSKKKKVSFKFSRTIFLIKKYLKPLNIMWLACLNEFISKS